MPAAASGAPGTAPVSYVTDAAWEPYLKAAEGWLARLHEGVLYAARGDLAAAEKAWSRSIEDTPNAWAWRNLGALAAHRGQTPDAVRFYRQAHRMAPDLLPLTHELLDVLVRADLPSLALATVEELHADHRADGRVRMFEARAALDAGDVDRCRALIDQGIEVATVREGENSLRELWHDCQQRRMDTGGHDNVAGRPTQVPALPKIYDFTLHPEASRPRNHDRDTR
ncbi:tetratricopeptide repeat protein [Dactylosporangium sucinum]